MPRLEAPSISITSTETWASRHTVHAPGRQRVAQRPRDGVLSDDRFERLRPPLAGEDLIAHVALKVTVHPPSNDPYCELHGKPAPVRYSHGTREGRLTVAPFR